jgi:SAM-dependent methyltransferase
MSCPPRTSLFAPIRSWNQKILDAFSSSITKFLRNKSYDAGRKASEDFSDFALEQMKQKKGDVAILKAIKTRFTGLRIEKKSSKASGPDEPSGREESRIVDIRPWIAPLRDRPITYLDVGTSEGKITEHVVKELEIPADEAFGVDVVNQPPNPAFTFKKIDGEHLPFDDNFFDLITVFQAVHHFSHQKEMLDEIWRVMKPDGLLVLRDHNVVGGPGGWQWSFLDIIHALYDVVFNPVKTADAFMKDYVTGFTCYESKEKWTQVFANSGIQFVEYSPKRPDLYFSYYALYRKESVGSLLKEKVGEKAADLIEAFL